jgi:hypothetical protein
MEKKNLLLVVVVLALLNEHGYPNSRKLYGRYSQDHKPVVEQSYANPSTLKAESFKHHVDFFNNMEKENIVNYISNAESWEWMKENIPLFECPDKSFEQIYYYRWWTYRKHIKKTPDGFVLTEFLAPVGHAGVYNTISCALGHHIYEGRWLHDQQYMDEYSLFWYHGNKGGPQPHFHRYSNWVTDALYNRYLVNQNRDFVVDLLDDFVHDYKKWEKEKLLDNGLLWQHDVWDGMEESISGSRKHKNARPPLNSYMYANAKAISKIARLAGKADIAREYSDKAAKLKSLVQDLLWDDDAQFFKVRHEDGKLADVREEIGLIPWYFNLPDSGRKKAWLQILDPEGFLAPKGLMTAERRHPDFRSHGVGTCEWDGAVWPYATAQSLVGLANVLRNYEQSYVSKQNYFNTLVTYARSHRRKGKPYIGEYLDEVTGQWLTRDSDRSRYYNHSAFCDLVITGLVGLVPRDDNTVEVHPLSPADSWEWFCLDSVLYHSRIITILWDQTGDKYGKGKGLRIYADGKEIAHSDTLERVTGSLAK